MQVVKLKEEKGITILVLATTIIILLILAGISMAILSGDNGIIKKSRKSKRRNRNRKESRKRKTANISISR